MKRILLLLVGGTVCSSDSGNGVFSVSDKAGAALIENFRKSDSPFSETEFVLTENLFILSENMTVDRWNDIYRVYKKYTDSDRFDGVIFAHGTDTLGYSASLFSLLLSKADIPVFFVSSNAVLTDSRANGNDNFKAAVECICMGIEPNVYVCYKNISNGKMMLHLASRLKQCENYSEDFKSVGETDISAISPSVLEEIAKKFPRDKKIPILLPENFALKGSVAMITPYVGIDYSAFELSRYRAVLHLSYHSGTACADGKKSGSLLFLADHFDGDIYFSPAKRCGGIYESAHRIANENKIGFLYGSTNELIYSKLVIAYSLFDRKEDIDNFLNTEFNFEKFC
ncbi:MAG: asparaginase [Clostridia bacterium]|nr:asparaginase [Clostridia bacterium]